jgi:hypothetical protein
MIRTDWLSRQREPDEGRGMNALERQVQALQTAVSALATQLPLQAERTQQMAGALHDLGERLTALEARVLESRRDRSRDEDEALVKLRTAVARVERQLEFNADEARKTAMGLLERIERSRSSGPGSL